MSNEQFGVLILAAGAALLYLNNKGAELAHAINPVNPDNVFYGGFNEVLQTFTGDNKTFGEKIHQWTQEEVREKFN